MTDLDNGVRGLHHQLVQELGSLIASGELAADDQIVPEEVGDRFGVSRPVVREALRSLEAKGMVRPRPRTGTRVLPQQHWNLLDPDVIGWRVNAPGGAPLVLSELSDLRAAVEIHAARLCAENASLGDVRSLHEACDAMAATGGAGDLSGFTAADITFHTLILEASGNAIFRQFASPFAAFLHAREDLQTLPEHVADGVVEDHRAIAEAIHLGDGDLAETRLRGLVHRGRREIDERLGEVVAPADQRLR